MNGKHTFEVLSRVGRNRQGLTPTACAIRRADRNNLPSSSKQAPHEVTLANENIRFSHVRACSTRSEDKVTHTSPRQGDRCSVSCSRIEQQTTLIKRSHWQLLSTWASSYTQRNKRAARLRAGGQTQAIYSHCHVSPTPFPLHAESSLPFLSNSLGELTKENGAIGGQRVANKPRTRPAPLDK